MADTERDATVADGTWRAGVLLWGPGLTVAVGAGVVTAHGLYVVALAAGVPAGVAWLYPLITDGLALVAYGATHRLAGRSGYAWAIVVLAAGLSGLAQAVHLAHGAGVASFTTVRFGVGAWPAIAAALTAHLLYLLGNSSSHSGSTAALDDSLTTTPVPASLGIVEQRTPDLSSPSRGASVDAGPAKIGATDGLPRTPSRERAQAGQEQRPPPRIADLGSSRTRDGPGP